jgi:hypothetical protein
MRRLGKTSEEARVEVAGWTLALIIHGMLGRNTLAMVEGERWARSAGLVLIDWSLGSSHVAAVVAWSSGRLHVPAMPDAGLLGC